MRKPKGFEPLDWFWVGVIIVVVLFIVFKFF